MRFIVCSAYTVVQANFLWPNIYRIIAVAVDVTALTPQLQSQMALAMADAQSATEVAEVEM